VLEDLQWSDKATVEMLAYLARRPEPLRLLVLATYRPAEVIARGHPLRQTVQELVAHQLCQELPLELLTEAQVQTYVAQRLGVRAAPAELGALLYQRTDGNVLFVSRLAGWLMTCYRGHTTLGYCTVAGHTSSATLPKRWGKEQTTLVPKGIGTALDIQWL
jgi:predicted ATPase